MNWNKRFFLITTMAVVILAAIAFGPVYKRTVPPVRAARPAPAVVLITCYDTTMLVYSSSTSASDSSVTLPTDGEVCATALQGIMSQGFYIDKAAYGGEEFNVWTLLRPTPENNR